MEAYSKLNGSKLPSGNFVWGAALSLAWQNLCKEIIHEPIKIKSQSKTALQIVENFNKSRCDSKMLSPDCYYAKSGFGNKTVHLINQQVAAKFPDKTTEKVTANLQDDSIISYAYFLKKLLFQIPFQKKQVNFNNKSVQGFVAKNSEQKKQIFVNQYVDDNNFVIQLKTKSKDDHVYIFKTNKDLTAEQAYQKIDQLKPSKQPLDSDDAFEMPKISLKQNRTIQQLIGVFLKNQKFQQYFFAQIYEIIKLDLDQTGVKVENEGVIKMLRSGIPYVKRHFCLDKPFWIVMREKNNLPYFVAHIVNLEGSQ